MGVATLGGWALVNFIYFKVAFDWVFRADVSIVAALLIAILFTLQITLIIGHFTFAEKIDQLRNLLPKSLGWRCVISYVSMFVLSNFVLFGFSKDISKEARIFYYRNRFYDDIPHVDYENVAVIGAILLVPIAVQYAGLTLLNRQK